MSSWNWRFAATLSAPRPRAARTPETQPPVVSLPTKTARLRSSAGAGRCWPLPEKSGGAGAGPPLVHQQVRRDVVAGRVHAHRARGVLAAVHLVEHQERGRHATGALDELSPGEPGAPMALIDDPAEARLGAAVLLGLL